MKHKELIYRANKVAHGVFIGMDFFKSCQTHNVSYRRFTEKGFRSKRGFIAPMQKTIEGRPYYLSSYLDN